MHHSIRWLSWKLFVHPDQLRLVAAVADSHYHPYTKCTGGKTRQIDDPDRDMKFIQRRILKTLLDVPMRSWVHGAIRGRSALSNAQEHLGKPSLGRLDIKNFFPSVSSKRVYKTWCHLGMGPSLAALLTRLTTYRGRLPQGAPTSSALANLALSAVDDRIAHVADGLRLDPSRFVDDIAITGRDVRPAMGLVIEAVRLEGFAVRHRKTKVLSSSAAQSVTGYNVNCAGGPSIPREQRDLIRAKAHRAMLSRQLGRPDTQLELSLRGSIAHLNRTNPGAAARLARYLEP